LVWLEALGFCKPGESGAYVEGGQRISLHGELPVNTGGGQLSAGRLSGFGHLYEVITQLRGDGGDRQVPGGPEVALVANGAGPIAGCVLLTTHN
jgi:acetyl-CoA acetyltransferase